MSASKMATSTLVSTGSRRWCATVGATRRAERWGRRTFAYELKHRSEGYYVLIEFTAEPTLVADLDRMLTLDDIVLRHKVLRQPDRQSGRALRAEAKRRDTAIRKAARAKAAS